MGNFTQKVDEEEAGNARLLQEEEADKAEAGNARLIRSADADRHDPGWYVAVNRLKRDVSSVQGVGAETKTGTRYADPLHSEELESREDAMTFLAEVLVSGRNSKNQAVFPAAKGNKGKELVKPAKKLFAAGYGNYPDSKDSSQGYEMRQQANTLVLDDPRRRAAPAKRTS